MSARQARSFDTPCTVELEQTHDWFHAHVILDGDVAIGPGDSVRVQGDPIRLAFGESKRLRRIATVRRAGPLERVWTRISSRLLLTELYEVSFTPERMP